MGTIVCQHCNHTIGFFEDEKVTTLYGKCDQCDCKHEKKFQKK
ncbi:GapA-binding peptide SR1P [Bacillus alveayuensis]|uniref:DNA replicative helicase MCM subunit Mcm2 (Cdc46/Mcm family) n=1 Tax=Aeribacillus alveayuensis TaxID=279215 RepID=A0ABT9VMB5_9BACI|nr:GapA-binding peptide SR1P [Bacillus alveayuensis]MDQ0162111.1 DNA replicative helicase MCM subunit Mcm2 (Cdc46/Mcm family) [Bacillus alveayuensis]